MLELYLNKKVEIIDSCGQTFYGTVEDYFFPEDNENGLESIVIKTSSDELYEFTENSIEIITII